MVNKKYSFFIIVVTIFLWFLIFFVIPFEKTQDEIVLSGETMGTTYEVKFYQNLSDYHQSIIAKDIDSILKVINMQMSTYIPTSDISLINQDTIISKSFIVSDEFKYVLDKSLKYYELTNGAFDVTVKPLLKLWGFRGKKVNTVPDSILIAGNGGFSRAAQFTFKKLKMIFFINKKLMS